MTWLRAGLGVAGLLVAAAAVIRDDPRLAWGAIALLAGSLIVRLAARNPPSGEGDRTL